MILDAFPLRRSFALAGLSTALTVTPWTLIAAESRDDTTVTQDPLSEQCQELLRLRQKAAEDQNAQNTELHERALLIRQAPDDQKLMLISQFLSRLAEQKSDDAKRDAKMQIFIAAHLMKHMQMAAPKLRDCMMMNEPTDMRDRKNMNDLKALNNQIAK